MLGCWGFRQERLSDPAEPGNLEPSMVDTNTYNRYKLFKKSKGTLGHTFFSARVVDLWNELDDSTVSVDNVKAFKRKLEKLGY